MGVLRKLNDRGRELWDTVLGVMATVELTTVLEYSGEDRIDDVDQVRARGGWAGVRIPKARRIAQRWW